MKSESAKSSDQKEVEQVPETPAPEPVVYNEVDNLIDL